MTLVALLLVVWLLPAVPVAQARNLGAFTSAADVGAPAIAGTTEFTSAAGEYRMTAAGANMWAKQDQFQFAWREMSGNFTVNATLRFLGEGHEHRKAGIMVRQSMDDDATYGDVVVHGNGMAGLQWRTRKARTPTLSTFRSRVPGRSRSGWFEPVSGSTCSSAGTAPRSKRSPTQKCLSEPRAGRAVRVLTRCRQIGDRDFFQRDGGGADDSAAEGSLAEPHGVPAAVIQLRQSWKPLSCKHIRNFFSHTRTPSR